MARSDRNAQFERYQRQLERQVAREQARTEAQAAREQEKNDKACYLADRRAAAAAHTQAVAQRLAGHEGLLDRAVVAGARPLDLQALRRTVRPAPFDLGIDAHPVPAPEWSSFAPPTPGLLSRSVGRSRHERAAAEARAAFAAAERRHAEEESARLGRMEAARVRYTAYVADLTRAAEHHNGFLDRVAAGLPEHDRLAVSDYYQMVVDAVADPDDFPAARRAAYVPESQMLVVE